MACKNKCRKCDNDIKKDEGLDCSGPCKNIFQLKCVAVSPRDAKIFKNVEGCEWFCTFCRQYLNLFGQISKDLDNFKESVLSELQRVNEKLARLDNKEDRNSSESKKTYANTLKGEAIVIKPKLRQDSSKTREMVTQKLNPCTMEVGITQFKEVKDGGVLIKCKTKHEIEKLKKEAEKSLGTQFQVSLPEKKNPCIKIVDFKENMSAEALTECILKQNEFLRSDNVKIKVLIVKKMITRFMAIVECDAETHGKILHEGSLSIGWVPACRVFDYIHIFRCYQCGGYGHGAKECKGDKVCVKCGSSDHVQQDCDSSIYKCKNCDDANHNLKLNFDINHSMYDINKCMVHKKQFNAQKQKIKTNLE